MFGLGELTWLRFCSTTYFIEDSTSTVEKVLHVYPTFSSITSRLLIYQRELSLLILRASREAADCDIKMDLFIKYSMTVRCCQLISSTIQPCTSTRFLDKSDWLREHTRRASTAPPQSLSNTFNIHNRHELSRLRAIAIAIRIHLRSALGLVSSFLIYNLQHVANSKDSNQSLSVELKQY